MKLFLCLLKQDTQHLFRHPMWLFFSFPYPFLLTVILSLLNSNRYGGSVSAYDFYGVTMLLYAALNTSMTAANSFMEERIKSGNMRILFSPLPTSFIYLSKAAAAFLYSFFWHLVTLLLLIATFRVNYGGIHLWQFVLMLAHLECFAAALGIFMCCLFREEGMANQVLSLLITVSTLLGGGFFRLSGLGSTLAAIGRYSPFGWIAASQFRIIYDHDFTGVPLIHAGLFFITLTLLCLCRLVFKKEDYV